MPDAPPPAGDRALAGDRAAVALRRVSCTYGVGAPDAVDALVDVDLLVGAGQFVSVIGPSGSGKSTLLRVVAGLLAPDRGQVEVLGRSPQEAAAAKRIGFVPQSPALLPWRRVIDNVRLPLQVNRRPRPDLHDGADAALELLGRVGLGDVAMRRPRSLSGGMAQRVAIARTLATRPELLVLDEPFSALDELTREVLRDVLLDAWEAERATALFVTHSVAEAIYLSDRIVVLSSGPGRILADVAVGLPRPRTPELLRTSAWTAIEVELRAALRSGWSLSGDERAASG